MAQTRGSFTQLYDNTDRRMFVMLGKHLKELPDIWKKYTKVLNSERMTEISQNVVGFGDVPERAEGAPFATDVLMPGHQKTVTHSNWGMAYECTIEAMEDDRYDQIKKYAMWLAFTMGYTLEKRAANILNNGFTTETTADRVSLFNANHPLVRGGTASNRTDADLSWATLRDAVITLETETKHDSGQLASAVTDLVIVVPPHLEMLADRIINSNGIPDQQDNGRNSLKARRDFSIVVNKLLTDTDAWFLLASNKDMHGVKAYERVAIQQMEPETEPRTKNRLYPIRARYSFFADTWQNSFGSAGA